MEVLKIVLLVLQLIACVVLTAVVMFQSGKEDGLGALAGKSETYLGKGKSATMDAKLASLTKWVAAAFALLTLFTAMVWTAF
ncbi:MAG: preprotein translocase subunit SecG [Oscillospiraceae bacterium]|nr:preprotein translocase subunit SecG [Oscillospiraceae bacterium]